MCRQANFEETKEDGAFEAQYRKLLEEIQQIYNSAKEFHGKVRLPEKHSDDIPRAPNSTTALCCHHSTGPGMPVDSCASCGA